MEIASSIDRSFDAKGFWKGHDVRLSVTFLMSAVGILRASTLECPDDSIRIQARSEGPDLFSSPFPLTTFLSWYNRSPISREIRPYARVAVDI